MKKKILVLCVDRDDDLGKKANVVAPLVGEKANLDAAQKLALADPSESDVNAIYKAVSTYREFKEDGEDVEVATIVGHRTRGSKADREVVKSLEGLLEMGKYTSLVLVTDGADDEQVMPIIQSRIKVDAVKTVIIKQTKELEKSYYVIKEVLKDPYFARIIFGLPGVLLLIGGITWLFGMEKDALKIMLIVGGSYAFIRGFGIEDLMAKTWNAFKKTTSIERASSPLYAAFLIVFLLSLLAGYDFVTSSILVDLPEEFTQSMPQMAIVVGFGFILGFIGPFTLSMIFFFFGRIGDMYYRKEVHRIKRYGRSIVSMVSLSIIVSIGSEFVLLMNNVIDYGPSLTDLILWFGFSVLLTLVGFNVVRYLYIKRYVQPRLMKGLEVRDLKRKKLGEINQIDYKNHRFYYSQGEKKFSLNFGKVAIIRDAVIVNV
ncbi:DUF373 family protein [archaeon]|nr:DUF373 family protein [archaeon]